MHILRETNLSSTAHLFESSAPVHGITADANGGTPPVSVDLHDTIEKLLGSSSALLNPSLVIRNSEVLRTLNDGGLVIGHVLDNQLPEEIRTRAEISVKDGKEVTLCAGEGPTEVTGLTKAGAVIADNVVETVGFSERANRVRGAIVKDIDLELGGGPVELDDVLVGVLQNLKRLGAAGEVDIDSGSCLLVDGELFHNLLVAIIVPVATDNTNKVGDDEVDVEKADKHSVPGKDGTANSKEPHTGREGQEGDDAEDVERNTVGVHVAELLLVIGAGREDEARLLLGAVGVPEGPVAPLKGISALAGRRAGLFRIGAGRGSGGPALLHIASRVQYTTSLLIKLLLRNLSCWGSSRGMSLFTQD